MSMEPKGNDMADELLPCPKCGEPGRVYHDTHSDYESQWSFRPMCNDGDCIEGPHFDTVAKAVAWWNARLSRPSTAEAVAVKALEWSENGPSKRYAYTPFGRYELTNHMAIEWHAHFGGKAVGDGPWRTEAKAAAVAQADYERRIRSALTHPSPQGGAEPAAFTGSGSLEALKAGGEGFIYAESAPAHPVPLYTHPIGETGGPAPAVSEEEVAVLRYMADCAEQHADKFPVPKHMRSYAAATRQIADRLEAAQRALK